MVCFPLVSSSSFYTISTNSLQSAPPKKHMIAYTFELTDNMENNSPNRTLPLRLPPAHQNRPSLQRRSRVLPLPLRRAELSRECLCQFAVQQQQ